ncbi:MAG: ATP-binding protein [Lactobacillus sp.]|nr:ATP-binding protein [Lactobacillus sp.]
MTLFKKIKSAFSDSELDSENNLDHSISRKTAQMLERRGYNLNFIQRIQPQGGLQFDDRNAIAGDGYFACITITDYPVDPDINWLYFMADQENSIMLVDIATDSTEKIRRQADNALNELRDRAVNGNRQSNMDEANSDYWDIKDYVSSLTKGGEVSKKIIIRIYAADPVLEQLEEKVRNIRSKLKADGYGSAVYAFTQKEQFEALHIPLNEQEKMFKSMRPKSLGAFTLGAGVPFNALSLSDQKGIPLGRTATGGQFIFDQFKSTKSRRSFDMMILGKMGMGKSTLMKMIEEGTFARGYYWRGIDKTQEYVNLVKSQDGKIITLGGEESRINPLQVMATATDQYGNVDELHSFYRNLDKISLLIKMLNNNELTSVEVNDFADLLRQFYIDYGIVPKDFQDNKDFKITGFAPNYYPTMSDFKKWVDSTVTLDFERRIDATAEKRRTYEKIKSSLTRLIGTYGAIFDGHSSIQDLSKEKIVLYDTSSIANLDSAVYQAQLYMALSLIWNDAITNGRRQNYLLKNKKITKDNVKYFCVALDECHNIINAQNSYAVNYVANFTREMRKYYAGMIMATQSPEEMMPDNIADEKLAALRIPVQLCQYKVFLGMDHSQMEKAAKLVGDDLSSSDFKAIPDLQMGDAIFSFGGKKRYRIHVEPNERQLEMFNGGQ